MGQVIGKEKFYSKTMKFNQEGTKEALNDFGSESIITMSTHVRISAPFKTRSKHSQLNIN